MNKLLNNKIVFITGASSGLGREIAIEAAKCGAVLILCARREERLKAVKLECERLSNKKAYYYVVDLSKKENVNKLCIEVEKEFKKIDVLVNNAGFGKFSDVPNLHMYEVENMFNVNTYSVINFCNFFVKNMKEQGSGHIINVVSQAGKMAFPEGSVYSATKFATYGFSNALRLELYKYGIYVTTVNPGPIDTEFFDAANSVRDYVDRVKFITLDANKLAKKIVKSMCKNKREINSPFLLEFCAKIYTVFPSFGDFLAKKIFRK